jgi:hypothetical protein
MMVTEGLLKSIYILKNIYLVPALACITLLTGTSVLLDSAQFLV